MSLTEFVFPKLQTPKTWLDKRLKGPVSSSPKIVFIGSQCVNKHSQDLAFGDERTFRKQFACQLPMNMIKLLGCRFQHCLGRFPILLLEASSEMILFRHLSDSIDLTVISESDKVDVMQIATVLGHVYHVACWRVVYNGSF